MSEQFNKHIAPVLSDYGSELGSIQDDPDFPKEVGKLWLQSAWIDVAKARELRDWLNEVIPEDSP